MIAVAAPDAAACDGSNLTYYGGPVLWTPHIYLVWWGWGNSYNTDAVVVPYVNAFARGFGGTRSLGILTQYSQDLAYFDNQYDIVKGYWRDDTNPLPQNPWNPYAIPGEAVRAAQHFGTESDYNALYVVLVPHRQDANGNVIFPASYCARHGSTTDNNHDIAYVDFPYQPDGSCYSFVGSDETTDVFEHELTEAITDPYYQNGYPAWQDSTPSPHCEIADKCGAGAYAPLPRFDTSSPTYFAEPKLWSNEANSGTGGCVDTYAHRANFFARGSNGYLYMRYDDDGGSSSWKQLPSQPNPWVTDAGVASWGESRIDLFVVGGAGNVRSGYSTNGGATMGWGNWGKPANVYPSYTALSSPTVVCCVARPVTALVARSMARSTRRGCSVPRSA